jgi:diguanylate cyclase (GGDEF)-like protein
MADEFMLGELVNDPHLPTPPALALQVCERAGRPGCSLAEIAEIIRQDPALCDRLLKTVNSPLFGLSRPLASLDRALALLGLRSVRSLVLILSLPAFQGRKTSDAQMRAFWKASIAGAVIARELAVRMRRPDPEDDLAAGLLRDVGMLVLQQVRPEAYAQVMAQPPELLATHQSWLEEQALGVTHAEVSASLLLRWGLAADITEAIRHHHQPDQAASVHVADRALLLFFASQAAQLLLTPGQPALARSVVELARERFGMNEQELGDFLEPLTPRIEALAGLLQVDIGPCDDFTVVLARGVEELMKKAVQTSRDAGRTEGERREAEQEALRWRRTALRLRREAIRDPLTDTYNRGFLEEALALEFKRAVRRSKMLGLIALDLVGFKSWNDRHGHSFGDQALREVARRLRREVRGGEIVARFGGDEFCIVVPDTSVVGVTALAGRLCQGLNPLTVRHGSVAAEVSAAVGAVVCFPRRPGQTYEHLLAAADKAIDAARAGDTSQVVLLSLLSDEDAHLLEEVRPRLYSAFLLQSARATEEQLREAARWLPGTIPLLGRVARRLGWLSPRQLQRILFAQRQSKQMFGEIALALGYLTREQLYSLLAIQRERPSDLADSLVDLGILTEQEARQSLAEYYQVVQGMGRVAETAPPAVAKLIG